MIIDFQMSIVPLEIMTVFPVIIILFVTVIIYIEFYLMLVLMTKNRLLNL